VSIDLRQTLKTTAGIIVLLAAAMPRDALLQLTPESAAERQRQLVERIQDEQARQGPNAAGLISPLTALAQLYLDVGDRALAAATLERARQVVRANHGLQSLEQVRLIRQQIALEESAGNAGAVWRLEEELLSLARLHPSDLRTVTILREAGDRRTDILHRVSAGENPPEVALGCYYHWRDGTAASDVGTCRAGSTTDAIRNLTLDARRAYAEAIAVLLRHGHYDSAELRELEGELLRNADRARGRADFAGFELVGRALAPQWQAAMQSLDQLTRWTTSLNQRRSGNVSAVEPVDSLEPGTDSSLTMSLSNYLTGRLSLERLYAYEELTSAPWARQVERLIHIADWDLLHSYNRDALRQYELAYRMLQENAETQALADQWFAPETPVLLPAFSPNPLSSDATSAWSGYIDVAFDVTRQGESRRVRILDTTTNASAEDRNRLVHLIRGSRFRPQATDSQFARRSPVVLRYYLYE
jgi:hypothetical protein